MPDRVFVDANLVFSAAWKPDGLVRRLWSLPPGETEICTTSFAAGEAVRNAGNKTSPSHPELLTQTLGLLMRTRVLRDARDRARQLSGRADWPEGAPDLPEKDRPIMWAAIEHRCNHLVTGDRRHFGPLFGHDIGGVRVTTARDFLQSRINSVG